MSQWFHDIPYVISVLNVLSLGVTFSLLVFLLLNRKRIGANTGLFMLSAIFFWSLMQVIEFSVQGLETKLLFHQLKYIGILSIPGSWLLFSFDFSGQYTKYMNRLIPIIGIAYPLILITLYFTNDWHGLFWEGLRLTDDGRYVVLFSKPPYVFFLVAIYFPVVAGFFLLFRFVRKIPSIQKPMLRIITIAGLIPFAAKSADVFQGSLGASYDMSIVSFGLISFMIILALKRRHYKNIPTAHDEIVQHTQDPVIVATETNEIVYANPAAFRICSRGTSIERQNIFFIFMEMLYSNRLKSRQSEIMLGERTFDVRYFPILKNNKRITNKVFVLRDTTKLIEIQKQLEFVNIDLEKRVEIRTQELNHANMILNNEIKKKEELTKNLSQNLDEKKILLGELHHRVKNNLQIISSLLKLQLRRLDTEEAREVFQTAVSRIHVIAMIHEKLYKNEEFSHADLNDYLTSLINNLTSTYKEKSGKITLLLDIAPITLEMNQSILIGLIVNELVINSLKHGFGPDDDAVIHASLEIQGKNCCFTYRDNGKGLAGDSFMTKGKGLGSKIIMTLVQQLDGIYEIPASESGFSFSFSFPVL